MIRFDTRDKKPKLYHLLAEAAAVGVSIGVMLLFRVDAVLISLFLNAFLLSLPIQLLIAFRAQLGYNPYSYNTIFYFGFSVYSVFVWITHCVLIARMIRYPEMSPLANTVFTLSASAKSYIVLTTPFLLLFSAALCVSNVALIRREGRRPVNMLGILLSFLLTAGAVFLFVFDFTVSGSEFEIMVHDLITNLFASVFLYFECMLAGTIVAEAIAARYRPEYDKEFLIILGCGLRKDGTPTPLLCGRLDQALDFARKQEEATGKKLYFIPSGGRGENEIIAESESMKRYLMEKGVPEDRILPEDRSRNTSENMAFSKEKILECGKTGKIAFATTNYHVFRSGLLARRAKMRAVGFGAKTKWYFWPNASVREFAGLLASHKGKQAAVLGTMIAFYLVLTILSYRL